MPHKGQVLIAVAAMCMCLLISQGISVAETVTLHANFNPDKLSTPTNLSVTAIFGSTNYSSAISGPLSPATAVTIFGPAGMALDIHGAGKCDISAAELSSRGPASCPTDSRVGFGKAIGLLELAKELIHEPFTLEFFLAPSTHGHLVLLIYLSAAAPVAEQFVIVANEVRAHAPYGLGLSLMVPIIPSLPGASLGWAEKVLVTLGSANVAYYKTIHGKRTLVHVRGLTVPKVCPRGGFPLKGEIAFADGSSTATKTTIPCPHG